MLFVNEHFARVRSELCGPDSSSGVLPGSDFSRIAKDPRIASSCMRSSHGSCLVLQRGQRFVDRRLLRDGVRCHVTSKRSTPVGQPRPEQQLRK